MKRFLLFTLVLIQFNLSSQTWFEVGVKGGPAITFLTSNNVFDDSKYDHMIKPAYFFGGKLGVNFGEENGVSLQVGRTAIRQHFRNNYENRSFVERDFRAKVLDLGVLYHRTKDAGYFEIGPRMSLTQSAEMTDDNNTINDMTDELNSSYFGFDIGFGSFFMGNERLTLMTGFRLSYGISPIMSDDRHLGPIEASYTTANNVHLASAMFCLELNYSLGYLVRSNCGRRTTWLSF